MNKPRINPPTWACQLGAIGGAIFSFGIALLVPTLLQDSVPLLMLAGFATMVGSALLGIGWCFVRRPGRVPAAFGSIALSASIAITYMTGEPVVALGIIVFPLSQAFLRGMTGVRISGLVAASALLLAVVMGPSGGTVAAIALFNANTLAWATIGVMTAHHHLSLAPVKIASGSTSMPAIAMS